MDQVESSLGVPEPSDMAARDAEKVKEPQGEDGEEEGGKKQVRVFFQKRGRSKQLGLYVVLDLIVQNITILLFLKIFSKLSFYLLWHWIWC